MPQSAKQFAIAPEADALDRIDRQLAFFPVRNECPRRLSPAQLDEFNARGYLTGIRIFPSAEIAAIRRRFDALLQQVLADGGDSYSISSAHLTHADAYDLLADDRIVEYVSDILGPDVVGWGCHYFCKMPHDGKRVDWHQDATYWPLTPSKTVTVWLAIDDADSGNACMRFVPGSHLRGPLPFAVADDESTVLNQKVSGVEEFDPPVDNELQAGEISLHSDLLLHGSEANDSDRRRCGLTLRYCAAEVSAYLDWNLKGVVLRGSDPARHWADPPRPPG
jgi:ectoine hydroxylase-related dioxygenase (phytanoyl-CoA dioxygenase family)